MCASGLDQVIYIAFPLTHVAVLSVLFPAKFSF
jgi:hypothetical protein